MRKIARPGLLAIERHFNMSFNDVIKILHHAQKRSIKSLSDECGISRDTFQKQANRLGIKLRNSKEACALTENKGERHWAWGLRKENSAWAKMHSDRMKKDNPAFKLLIKSKRAKSMIEVLKKRKLPQEIKFQKILEKNKIEYEWQKPCGPYNMDFYLPKQNLCVEIDSTRHWGGNRTRAAKIRDAFLLKNGFKTVRINKELLDKPATMKKIIDEQILSQCSRQ